MSRTPPPSRCRPSVALTQLPRSFGLKDVDMATPLDVFDANRKRTSTAEFIRVHAWRIAIVRATHEGVTLAHVARRARISGRAEAPDATCG
jgi:hypothetical protein